jgi:YtcA family
MRLSILAGSAIGGRKVGATRTLPSGHLVSSCPVFFVSGCNPVISVAGANFPVWMLCLFAGILTSLALRPVFVATGIDEWMTPRPLIYSCLALAIAFLCWLVLWR